MQKTLCRSLVLCLLALASCSVKEDRSDCPCLLTIDLSLCQDNAKQMSLKGWNASSSLFGRKVLKKDYPDGIKIMVPRGNVSYSIFTAVPSYHQTGSVISCPTGSQAEPLFAYRQTVVAAGETAYDRVELHKQHSVLNISFGLKEGDHAGISEIAVKAECNGMSTEDLSPQKGDFSARTSSDDGFFTVLVPRQGKGAITLEAYAGDNKVREEDLAEILRENGYDWEAEDLDDVWIDFDLGLAECTVEINRWEEGISYPETI